MRIEIDTKDFDNLTVAENRGYYRKKFFCENCKDNQVPKYCPNCGVETQIHNE